MNLVNYEVVLNNCGARTVFEDSVFNKLLRNHKFEWKNIILKRHHEFIESYIKNKGNLKSVGEELGYCVTDLRAIFLRIQSQFELYEEDNTIIFTDMIKSIHGLPVIAGLLDFQAFVKEKKRKEIKKRLEFKETQIIHVEKFAEKLDDSEELAESTVEIAESIEEVKPILQKYDLPTVVNNLKTYVDEHPKARRVDKINKYIEEFKTLEDISVIKDKVSLRTYNTLISLLEGKSLEEIATSTNSAKDYLSYLILGYKKARSKSEKGIVRILYESLEN